MSWRIDGNVLASTGEDASIKLWEMENGTNIKSWNAHSGGTSAVEFCRDGRLVSCGRDKVTKIWDQNGQQLRALEPFGDLALQVSHCDETDRVISGDWTGDVRVHLATDGTRVGDLAPNPPTLAMRIDATNAAIPVAQSRTEQTKTAFDQAVAQRTAQAEKLDAANTSLAAARQMVSEYQSALAQKNGELTTAQTQNANRIAQIKALTIALPSLTRAVEHAQRAAAAIPGDEQLASVATTLGTQLAQRQETAASLSKTVARQNEAIIAITAAVAQLTDQIAESEQAVVEAQTIVTKEAEALPALQQTEQTKQSDHAAAQQSVVRLRAELTRWQQYVSLRDELAVLRERSTAKDAAHIALLEAQAALNEHEQNIATIQQAIATHQKTIADAPAVAADLATKIDALNVQRAEQDKAVAQLTQAVPLVQEAVTQTAAAIQTLPDDMELKASLESLTAVVTERTAALAGLQKQQTDAAAALNKYEQATSAAEQTLESAKTSLANAEKQLPVLQAELVPLQERISPRQTEFNAAEAAVVQAKSAVEEQRGRLRESRLIVSGD